MVPRNSVQFCSATPEVTCLAVDPPDLDSDAYRAYIRGRSGLLIGSRTRIGWSRHEMDQNYMYTDIVCKPDPFALTCKIQIFYTEIKY